MEVAQLYASLKLDSSQYMSGISAAKRGMQDTGKAAGDAQKETTALAGVLGSIKGLAMAAFSFEAVRRGAMYLIQTSSTMEQYRMRLRAVIESQKEADETFARIKDWAAFNPVNTDEAVESFVLLKAAAVDNTEVAVKAVGNLAKVMGRDMRDVAMAIVGFNTMQMRRLGILLDQTGSKATIQIGKLRREVEKDIGVMRQNLVEMIEEAYGRGLDMAKGTFQGIMDTISGQLQNFRVDLAGMDEGTPFRKIVEQLQEMSDAFDAWQKSDSYKQFIQNFQDIAVVLIKGTEGIAKFTAEVVTSDIGSTLLKWGIGLKVGMWGFGKLVSLGKGIGEAFTGAAAELTAFKATLTGILDKFPWLYKVMGGGAAAGIGAGIAAYTAMDKGPAGLETLEERRGLGMNLGGLSLEIDTERSIKALRDAKRKLSPEVRELMEGLNKEIAPYLAESGADIGKAMVKYAEEYAAAADKARIDAKEEQERLRKEQRPLTEKILDPLNEAIRIAQKEFDKAREMASAFGLDTGKVLSQAAETAKDKMEDILKSTLETFGPGGIMAIADRMRKFDAAVPGLKKIADAIEGIEEKTKGAKEQLSGLNNELNGLTGPLGKVMNALKKGLFKPEDFREVKEYIESNFNAISEKIRDVVKLEFPGMSDRFRGAISTMMGMDIAEGFGMKRIPGTAPGTIGAGTRKPVEVELSPAALKGISEAQKKTGATPVAITINQYGFNVKSERDAREMGRLATEGVRLGLTGAQ